MTCSVCIQNQRGADEFVRFISRVSHLDRGEGVESGGEPVELTVMEPAEIDRIAREMSPAGPADGEG